jgi:hypothetical protein
MDFCPTARRRQRNAQHRIAARAHTRLLLHQRRRVKSSPKVVGVSMSPGQPRLPRIPGLVWLRFDLTDDTHTLLVVDDSQSGPDHAYLGFVGACFGRDGEEKVIVSAGTKANGLVEKRAGFYSDIEARY